MTSRDFAYWLQGFFELTSDNLDYLDETQIDLIKRHLHMVFIHEIDPSFPAEQQDALSNAHNTVRSVDIEVNPLHRNWYGAQSDTLGGAIAKC